MIRRLIAISLLITIPVLLPETAVSQDSSTSAQQQEQAKREKAEQEKRQAALRDFLNDQNTARRLTPGAAAELKVRFLEFRMAIPKFRTATDDYRWALSLEDKLEKSLKNIEEQTDIMLRYLTLAKVKHPKPDPSEFKDYSSSELAWETLNSAERIGTVLDFAVAMDRQDVISKQSLEFLYTLDGELLRLKWLATHAR